MYSQHLGTSQYLCDPQAPKCQIHNCASQRTTTLLGTRFLIVNNLKCQEGDAYLRFNLNGFSARLMMLRQDCLSRFGTKECYGIKQLDTFGPLCKAFSLVQW